MKIAIIIMFVIFSSQFCLAQTPDSTDLNTISTVVSVNDSIFQMMDSLFGPYTAMGPEFILVDVPTCSCLNLKDDKFYLENDSIPYNGTCVVLMDISVGGFVSYRVYRNDSYYATQTHFLENFSIIGYITIISKYTNGKRDGNRRYYDKNGKLLKTEKYENGILIETTYQ